MDYSNSTFLFLLVSNLQFSTQLEYSPFSTIFYYTLLYSTLLYSTLPMLTFEPLVEISNLKNVNCLKFYKDSKNLLYSILFFYTLLYSTLLFSSLLLLTFETLVGFSNFKKVSCLKFYQYSEVISLAGFGCHLENCWNVYIHSTLLYSTFLTFEYWLDFQTSKRYFFKFYQGSKNFNLTVSILWTPPFYLNWYLLNLNWLFSMTRGQL